MTTPYTRILAALTAHAPADEAEALVNDLAAMRADLANAREAVLDEVGDAIQQLLPRRRIISHRMTMVFEAVEKLRTPPADPELARLEREVARAAVAHVHADADALVCIRSPDGVGYADLLNRCDEARASATASHRALRCALITKREGGAK